MPVERARYALTGALGADLRSLLDEVEGRLLEVEPISGLDAPKHRAAAFCLRFEGDRRMKGRRLRDADTAERVHAILQAVPHPIFPRVIARKGCALLMEWIEGRALDGAVGPAALRAVARFQATLHATPPSPDFTFWPDDAIGAQRARCHRHVDELGTAGVLEAAEADDVRALLQAYAPTRCELGYVHGDLCGENIVLDGAGSVRVIDNEAMTIGPTEGDLARTLYRWPLDRADRETYLEAYAEQRELSTFTAHYPFWALAARLGSAAHRIGAPDPVEEIPIRSLRNLLRGLRGDPSPMQLILESDSPGETSSV